MYRSEVIKFINDNKKTATRIVVIPYRSDDSPGYIIWEKEKGESLDSFISQIKLTDWSLVIGFEVSVYKGKHFKCLTN